MRVLICGGGVIGACIAYFLSLRGAEAMVVERTGVWHARGQVRDEPEAVLVVLERLRRVGRRDEDVARVLPGTGFRGDVR